MRSTGSRTLRMNVQITTMTGTLVPAFIHRRAFVATEEINMSDAKFDRRQILKGALLGAVGVEVLGVLRWEILLDRQLQALPRRWAITPMPRRLMSRISPPTNPTRAAAPVCNYNRVRVMSVAAICFPARPLTSVAGAKSGYKSPKPKYLTTCLKRHRDCQQ